MKMVFQQKDVDYLKMAVAFPSQSSNKMMLCPLAGLDNSSVEYLSFGQWKCQDSHRNASS